MAARRGAQEQHQARRCATSCRPARRQWWGSTRRSSSPHRLEGQRPPDHFTDPMVELPRVPAAIPRRPRGRRLVGSLLPRHQGKTSSRSRPASRAATAVSGRTLCPECGKGELDRTPASFQLMFKTFMGPSRRTPRSPTCVRRPPKAMFVNFDTTSCSMRLEACRSDRAGRRSVPQRDHAGHFHLPRLVSSSRWRNRVLRQPNDRVDGRRPTSTGNDRWIEDCLAWFKRYGCATKI